MADDRTRLEVDPSADNLNAFKSLVGQPAAPAIAQWLQALQDATSSNNLLGYRYQPQISPSPTPPERPMVLMPGASEPTPYPTPPPGDPLYDALGITDLSEAFKQAGEGEYLPAAGSAALGAASLPFVGGPIIKGATGIARESLPILKQMMRDETGAVRLPRSTKSVAGKGVQTANPDVAGPPIAAGSEGPLFNYSLASEEPPSFVPQTPLARMAEPPKGIPAHYRAVEAPENIERMKARIEEGIKRGGLKWFGPGPLYDAWGNVLNDQGPAALRQYMESLGGTTNLSQVPTNAKNASYHYWLWRNGQPVPASSADILPGYGHIAQDAHLQNMREIRAGEFSTAQHPKPPSFTENALGNFMPVTWDQRMGTFGDLRNTKGKIISAPDQDKYGFLENIVQRLASERKVPIHPAGAQASGWLTTGRDYENKTFAEILEDVIRRSAESYGIDPRVMRDRFIGAVDPLR